MRHNSHTHHAERPISGATLLDVYLSFEQLIANQRRKEMR